jgi:hypothetical protein
MTVTEMRPDFNITPVESKRSCGSVTTSAQLSFGAIFMVRKVLVLVAGCYLAGLAMLALSLHNASPGPASQEILGVGIGRHDQSGGIVYLSGRYLQCARPKDQLSGMSTCRIELAGRTLEIHAQRNPAMHPNQLGGTCTALYAGKAWPCRVDSRHIQVPWFAYLDEPLGLNSNQLAALRQHYLLENLSESSFWNGNILFALTTAVLFFVVVGVWLWPRTRHKFSGALLTIVCGAALGYGAWLLAIFLTNGFWD